MSSELLHSLLQALTAQIISKARKDPLLDSLFEQSKIILIT